jgi:glutamate decarboxylase
MELSFNKNMMDKDGYPQTAEIERRCVPMLADLWHGVRPVQVVWHKFATYWDIEMREIPMAPGRYMMDPAASGCSASWSGWA